MKYLLFIFVISISFCSCAKKDKPVYDQTGEKKETPRALEKTDSDISSFKLKGRSQDLLDEVYYELAEQRPDLQEIETLIEQSYEQMNDLQKTSNGFSDKNERYYGSAYHQVQQVKDSVLKTRIMQLLKTSENRYNTKSVQLNSFIQLMNQRQTSIKDYHTALKVIITLPAMEDYQGRNLPDTKPYGVFVKQQDSIILKMKKIIK